MKIKIGLFLLIISIILMACQPIQSIVKVTETPTRTPIPTATLTPTITITPTPSPSATVTPTATPTLTFTPTPTPFGGAIPFMAFIGRDKENNYALYMGNLGDTEFKPVVPIKYEKNTDHTGWGDICRLRCLNISVSPDNKKIIFTTGATIGEKLYYLDLETMEYKIIHEFTEPTFINQIMWSPDQNWIAYVEEGEIGGGLATKLWIVNLRDFKRDPLTSFNTKNPNELMSWSSNSEYLYFRNRQNLIELDVKNLSKTVFYNFESYYKMDYDYYYFPNLDMFFADGCFYKLENKKIQEFQCGIYSQFWGAPLLFRNGKTILIQIRRAIPQLYDLTNLYDKNITQIDVDRSAIYPLGITPDQQGFLVLSYKDGGREMKQSLPEIYKSIPDIQGRNNVIEMVAEFDKRIHDMYQLSMIDATTGKVVDTYLLPNNVSPVISWWPEDEELFQGIGIGIGWR